MTTSITTFIDNPVSGTHYASFFWSAAIPNNGATANAHVTAWSGIGGTGSLVTVATLTAMCKNESTGTTNTITGNNAVVTRANAPETPNGSNVYRAWGWYTNGTGIGSLGIDMEYSAGSFYAATISSISINHGRVTDIITVSGTHFQDITFADFNGHSASFTASAPFPNDTSVTVTVPLLASAAGNTLDGPIHVGSPAGTAASATFTETGWKVWNGTLWEPITPANVEAYNGTAFVGELGTYVWDGTAWNLQG